jgi:GAF domain-containing protein
MKAPIPHNEDARIKALHQYEILDTAEEKAFDDLTRLAVYICKTPIALISLVDSDRQWFKSRVGMTQTELSRDASFCSHAIMQDLPLIARDTLLDERFSTNPLVTSEPKIRFYAGAPLTTPEGYRIGTLCVLDNEPRDLSDGQVAALRALSRQVIHHLELRRKISLLSQSLEKQKRANEELNRRVQEQTAATDIPRGHGT